ncbi:MAG: HEPN domain-containing protein [Spirochaetaceae bacterium]|jgi:HEPN domain-containing protein|nr:HEPN domain-containing protein [Spirochaetaceae bacterium]
MADENITKEDYAREWLQFAKMDVSSAEFLLGKRPVPTEIICYHCQQSAEKCLKGLLVLKGQVPPKNHDLTQLFDLCILHFPEIASIKIQCTALNPFSNRPRYPREIEITESQMKNAIENAKTVYNFIEPLIH